MPTKLYTTSEIAELRLSRHPDIHEDGSCEVCNTFATMDAMASLIDMRAELDAPEDKPLELIVWSLADSPQNKLNEALITLSKVFAIGPDDEDRDDHGRWSGGGGGGSDSVGPEIVADDKGRWTGSGNSSSNPNEPNTIPRPALVNGLKAEDYPSGHLPTLIATSAEQRLKDPQPFFNSDTWNAKQAQDARQTLADVVNSRDPAVRLPMSAFKNIVAGQALQNQVENGVSKAAAGSKEWYTDRRIQYEEQLFGYPTDTPAGQRPVYGYMAPTGHADFLDPNNDADVARAVSDIFPVVEDGLKQGGDPSKYLPNAPRLSETYGRDSYLKNPDDFAFSIASSRSNANQGTYSAVETKVWLRYRSSFSDAYAQKEMPNKLMYYPLGDGHGGVNREAVCAIANRTWSANQYGDVQMVLKRPILDTATVTGNDSIDYRLIGAPAKNVESADPAIPIGLVTHTGDYSTLGRNANYVEIQMEKHPTLDDIQHVYFTGAAPSRAMKNVLDAHGITYDVNKAPTLRSQRISFSEAIA